MQENDSRLIDLAENVIEPQASGEKEIESAIRDLVRGMGFTARSQSTQSGQADIYLPENNLVIETKDRGKVNPSASGSLEDETQQEQLERYVFDLHASRRGQLGFTENRYWRGLLTDGMDWYIYFWLENDRHELYLLSSDTERPPITDPKFLVDWLSGFIGDAPEKYELPQDLARVFAGSREGLRKIYRDLSNVQDTITKFELWKDMMRGSGFDVAGSEEDLFIDHTFLVTVSEAVIASLSEDTTDPCDVMSDGFASWPQRRGQHGPLHHAGAEWVRRVFENADLYDWRSRERDVLRVLYQDIIDSQHRKSFGEFYTPDWLAQLVVDEVLDEEWIENSIGSTLARENGKGIGVLDPACGSGTFLFHAARKLLESDALKRQRMSLAESGRLVAQLVFGIDIHPVAVSIARATLMRALPPGSVDSPDELNVWQGDSLMLRRGMALASQDTSSIIEVLTPKQTPINVPMAFAESPRFSVDLRRIVATAHAGDAMPVGVGSSLGDTDFERLVSMHDTLTDVCREEGNSVWAWYLTNYISPYMLMRRGVDRVVANPPWVVMSDIQVPERKRALESRISELSISAGGKNAAGFDIAALFVDQCRKHYLKGDAPAAGWVLNWASMKAGNWSRVREKHEELTTTYLDFSKVRQPPFTGAKSCVWIQRGKPKYAPSTRVYSNRPRRDHLGSTDGLEEFVAKTSWVLREKHFVDAPSAYGSDGNTQVRRGACLFPQVLCRVSPVRGNKVQTTESRQKPWSDIPPLTIDVPEHHLRPTVFAAYDLLAFRVRTSIAIIPLNSDNSPDFGISADGSLDFRRASQSYWNRLNELYENHRGHGGATPKTLWEQINYQDKLMKQLTFDGEHHRKVILNKSGQIVRAGRTNIDVVLEDTGYYCVLPESHASYLVTMLNAPCLQLAYQESRESDRDFHLHPFRKVPIPSFDSTLSDHVELAELCELSEVVAQEVISGLADNTGQIKASNAIRQQLMSEGLADAIDDVVRRVLPSHSVHEYTDDLPHPWV